ncbi:hypothetical protein EDB92DRAFT_1198774 [Lactarius akahatsu]|uniref:Uncharacterized protein n=1 Tax=Lactarius akahatsu TaxID=416441 RepID=A0AAD4LQN5_9AGAM|nr:hypothetical protein EDB92DRAFT_1198774 [Lactarius akahatsu]
MNGVQVMRGQLLSLTLLIDGYLSQTFQSRAAEQYFLNLLKRTSIPSDATLSYTMEGYFCVHSVPPHIPTRFPNLPDRWLLDRGIVNSGTVVPQTMWSPRTAADKRQHVEEAELQMPIFFEAKDGRLGLSLGASIGGKCHGLRDAGVPAPLGQKTTTHIRIVWLGYKMYKRQIPTRDESRAHNPITMARFVRLVGRTVDAFFRVCELDSGCTDDRRKLWRIGPGGIQRNDIIIVGAVHVSAGTWVPIMQLNRYIF